MILKKTGDSTLHFPHHHSDKYFVGMITIGTIGAILGVLCGSIGIFSVFLIVGLIGKLWTDHDHKINRQ